MSLNEQNDLQISGQVIELRDQNDLRIGPESARVQIIAPTQGQTDFPQGGNYVVQPFQGFQYYWFQTSVSETFETLIENKIVKSTELQSELDANAQYYIKVSAKRVVQPSVPVDEVTGVTISSGSTITEGASRTFTITVSGTGNFSTDYTASILSGAGSISQSGNQVTVTANANSHPGNIEFQVDASGVTASRTLTIAEVAESVDSLQGDFDALQALFNSTQGEGIEVLDNESQRPSPANATYPFMYIINDEIHALSKARDRGIGEWVNHGAIWKDKTGWENMTPETMGDAVGVTTDENGRVIILDMQKVTLEPVGSSFATSGNGLIGILPPQIRNLKKMQWINIKQNFFHGEIPDVFDGWNDLERWSLGGQGWEIDLDNRVEWYETDHRRLSSDDNPFTTTSGGKFIVSSNNFTGPLPASLDGLPNLDLIECQHQYTEGPLPAWSNLPSIRGITIGDIRGPQSKKLGSIPESWGNFTTMTFFQIGNPNTHRRFSGNLPAGMQNWNNLANFIILRNEFTGDLPLGNQTDLVSASFSDNNFSGEFPWKSVFNGDNTRLSKLTMRGGVFSGVIPDDIDGSLYRLDDIALQNNNFSGPIPNWLTQLSGMQIMNFDNNPFDDVLPEGFNNSDSPVYRNFRVMYMNNTEVGGSLPRTVWNNTDVQGLITSNSGDQVTTDQSLGLVLSGTITSSAENYIRNINANHLQEWGGLMQVTVIVPDGENITWTAVMFADNTTYIWSPSSVDTSGLENLTYEVRLPLIGSTFLAKSGDDGFVREIVGSSDNGLTLDFLIEEDISGYTFTVHRPSNQLVFIYISNGNFSGRIPIEWSAIRTPRPLEIVLNGNNLSGYVDPGLGKIPNLARLEIRDNNFTEEDLEDLIAATPPEILDY